MFAAQRFFEPTEDFLSFVREAHWLKYRRIVDCGAGTGYLGSLLSNVYSIDKIPRDSYDSLVHLKDSTTFNFNAYDVVFICRPCHSPMFIDATIDRAFRNGVTDVFYIGLPKNVENDLYDYEYQIEFDGAGQSGENMYRVLCKTGKGETYAKINHKHLGERTGKIITRNGENWLVNEMGGGFPIGDAEILFTLEANSATTAFGYLNPANFDRPTNDNKYGWVAPDGAWYPCGSMDHDILIYDCFGIDSMTEHSQNWVKAYGQFYSPSNFQKRPNAAQLRTLRRIGFDTKDDMEAERTVSSLSLEEQTTFNRIK